MQHQTIQSRLEFRLYVPQIYSRVGDVLKVQLDCHTGAKPETFNDDCATHKVRIGRDPLEAFGRFAQTQLHLTTSFVIQTKLKASTLEPSHLVHEWQEQVPTQDIAQVMPGPLWPEGNGSAGLNGLHACLHDIAIGWR